jgi:hypothetical protein
MAASSEELEAVVECYRAAARANTATPARRGNVVVLDRSTAGDCLVSGDLHGNLPNLEAILANAALDTYPRRHLVLQEVCHGGPCFADGGCRSFEMLERVAALKVRYPERVHFLLSNHELAELTDYPIMKSKRLLNLAFRQGLHQAYGADADRVRDAYCEFIRTCPLAVRASDAFITHSLPEQLDRRTYDRGVFDRPYESRDLREHGAIFQLVWGRDHRTDNAHAFATVVGARVLIHGHEPFHHGVGTPNDTQVILDCTGDEACCVLLPVGESLSHAEVLERVFRLR